MERRARRVGELLQETVQFRFVTQRQGEVEAQYLSGRQGVQKRGAATRYFLAEMTSGKGLSERVRRNE